MPTNEFLTYADGAGANVEAQATYAAAADRTDGAQTGIAKSNLANKAWRQAAAIASALAQLCVNTLGLDMLDNANQADKITKIGNMITGLAWLNAALSGTPTAPTVAGTADNSTKIATTGFVQAVRALLAPLLSPTLTGVPTAPTAAVNTNTTQLATTAFVIGQQSALTSAGFFPQAWVKFTVSGGTPSIVSQHNVSGVVKNSTGNFTVTNTAGSLIAGAANVNCSTSGGSPNVQGSQPSGGCTTGANVFLFTTLANSATDPDTVFIQFY